MTHSSSSASIAAGVDFLSRRFTTLPQDSNEIKELCHFLMKVAPGSQKYTYYMKLLEAINHGCLKSIENDSDLNIQIMNFLEKWNPRFFSLQDKELITLLTNKAYTTWLEKWKGEDMKNVLPIKQSTKSVKHFWNWGLKKTNKHHPSGWDSIVIMILTYLTFSWALKATHVWISCEAFQSNLSYISFNSICKSLFPIQLL